MTIGALVKRIKSEFPHFFRDEAEVSVTELYKLIKQFKNELHAFPIMKFWEEAFNSFEISNSKNDISFVRFINLQTQLKENILIKSIQLSESAEILITVNLKKKDLHDRNTSKISHDESSFIVDPQKVAHHNKVADVCRDVFRSFEPIRYLDASSYELELHILTIQLGERLRSDNAQEQFIKRNLNLREIMNLQMAERAQRHGFSSIENKIYLSDIKDLANFILYKIKTSNIFNITLSLKEEDEVSESIEHMIN